jgi:D-alanyl-lipoteichoic acid acyltransferase DltB (MBOAT superfamily)
MWQDTVIALCQLAFLPSMIPTLLGKDKPALSTSIANAIIVSIITMTFVTLQLWFSVITGTTTASIWAILAVQKYKQRHNSHEV